MLLQPLLQYLQLILVDPKQSIGFALIHVLMPELYQLLLRHLYRALIKVLQCFCVVISLL
jgi:hypothetical protein